MSNDTLMTILADMPYSRSGWKHTNSAITEKTLAELVPLMKEHGYPEVLGMLSGIWSVDDASYFFNKVTIPSGSRRKAEFSAFRSSCYTFGTIWD